MGAAAEAARARTRRRASSLLAGLLALVAGSCAEPSLPPERIERSVVRISNHSQSSDWFAPWQSHPAQRSFGSGFIVQGGRVMTNAHVVSDARLLLLHLHGDPTPHEARVVSIGHDCDLALIEPLEPGLLDALPAMRFGGLPQLGSVVETFGYPTAGEHISSTRGVVSRIETNLYSHSGVDSHLTVQTDAAINPGNSGGPVVQGGAVVGVAFQAAGGLENIGFFIPTEVIEHFLRDVADGRYDGFPDLGASTVDLENPAAREAAGLPPGESGVLVDLVYPGSSADGFLREGDVVVSVEGQAVANDGSLAIGDLRLEYVVLVDRVQSGETVRITVLRDGQRLPFDIPLAPYPPFARYRTLHDQLPRYLVYGGLVFVPLTRDSLAVMGDSPSHLVYEYTSRAFGQPERLQREPVLLLRRLDHPVNAEMVWHRELLVERVNGRRIDRLEDLIAAFEENQGEFHVLEFGYFGRFGVIRREEADRAQAEILARYGIPQDRRL